MTDLRPCRRCELSLPPDRFASKSPVCRKCASTATVPYVLAREAATDRLKVVGASALLRMGLSVAALAVLDGEPWPSIQAAFRMQTRAA